MLTDEKGRKWWKGNLHTHTTASDGRKSPEEVIRLYREHGYDFLALTEHWKVTPTHREDGLLVLSGCEYNFGADVREDIYHILGVGMYTDANVTKADTPQTAIDRIRAAGGLAVLAHPAWSMNTPDQLTCLSGVDATEIFNSVSDLTCNCRPYSGLIADMLAARGIYWKLIADDDAHFYIPSDHCRSYIMVQAEENTAPALLAAIRRGDFYATQGPSLSVRREGDTVYVETSPVSSIVYYTDAVYVKHRSDVGENLTGGVYEFGRFDTYVRIEATDAEGRTAFSGCIVR